MNYYKTSDVARMMGVHVNTVRLYEACEFIPKAERKKNGYRVFTDIHMEQFRLARAALQVEVVHNGLRKQAVDIIKTTAAGDYENGLKMIETYLHQLVQEKRNAAEAIEITKGILQGLKEEVHEGDKVYRRKEAAEELHVTIDTLRNWELNGLFTIKRRENGYRIYTARDMERLKIIRALRCANYSLSSILRMLKALDVDESIDIQTIIDTPKEDEDIITVCDRLLTSLEKAENNALYVVKQIMKMKNPPL